MPSEDYDRDIWFGTPGVGWIYAAWGADDTCLYVGQTEITVIARVMDHIRAKSPWVNEFTRITSFSVPVAYLTDSEKRTVKKLCPTYNKTYLISNNKKRLIPYLESTEQVRKEATYELHEGTGYLE